MANTAELQAFISSRRKDGHPLRFTFFQLDGKVRYIALLNPVWDMLEEVYKEQGQGKNSAKHPIYSNLPIFG